MCKPYSRIGGRGQLGKLKQIIKEIHMRTKMKLRKFIKLIHDEFMQLPIATYLLDKI